MFKNVLQELIAHLQTLSRKAEVAERRHVEAARGKEKLTLAREHASRAVEALVKGQKLPRFTRTMLSQAWTDVMALTALRQGEDSPAWKRHLQVAERLIQIAQHPGGDHPGFARHRSRTCSARSSKAWKRSATRAKTSARSPIAWCIPATARRKTPAAAPS